MRENEKTVTKYELGINYRNKE